MRAPANVFILFGTSANSRDDRSISPPTIESRAKSLPQSKMGTASGAKQLGDCSASAPAVSILLVTRGEDTTQEVLRSIARQTFRDFEVIVSNASGSGRGFERIPIPQARFYSVDRDTPLLRARSELVKLARGTHSLLLDSTRPLRTDCLESLETLGRTFDMVVVSEGSIGDTKWAKLARVDKAIVGTPTNVEAGLRNVSGFVLPRYFKTKLLREAYESLRASIPTEIYDRVVFNDHQLVFGAALRQSQSIGFSPHPLIDHYEDLTGRAVASKYFRYGRSQAAVHHLQEYGYVRRLTLRRRSYKSVPVSDILRVQPLYLLRAASFLIGYCDGLARGVARTRWESRGRRS